MRPAPRTALVASPCAHSHTRPSRRLAAWVRPLFANKCGMSIKLNVVKEGEEEQMQGYPLKEADLVHFVKATYGFDEAQLQRAEEACAA